MKAGNFRQFADLELLTGIGRKLLTRFLDTFADDLAVRNIQPPSKDLTDTEFFDLASAVLAQPEPPAFLAEALSAIEELAHPDCRENIQSALRPSTFCRSPRKISPGPLRQIFQPYRWPKLIRLSWLFHVRTASRHYLGLRIPTGENFPESDPPRSFLTFVS